MKKTWVDGILIIYQTGQSSNSWLVIRFDKNNLIILIFEKYVTLYFTPCNISPCKHSVSVD